MLKINKALILFLILSISAIVLSSCSSNNKASNVTVTGDPAVGTKTEAAANVTAKPTTKPTAKTNKSTITTSRTSSSSSFTNRYGTPTTKCAHPGCNNYIASSGDTNCCTTHSKRCAECGKYIDEDALYCMDCIKKAFGH